MAKKLIPEELDALIQQYLTDGVLTEKERQVILRKAESMGLNRDEIDLYLDAEVQKIDQATDAAVRKQKSKSCPYCGAPIPQLADKCPECGQFITPEASKELQEILDNLEEALVDFKSGRNIDRSKAIVERYSRKAELYYSNNPKIKPLLTKVEEELGKAEKAFAAEARKEALLSGANSFLVGLKKFVQNKWSWCLFEIIAIGIIVNIQTKTIDKYEELRLNEVKEAQMSSIDSERKVHYQAANSAEKKRYSTDSGRARVIFGGTIMLIATTIIAYNDGRKK